LDSVLVRGAACRMGTITALAQVKPSARRYHALT
jgi:hypothetical protein